MRFAPALLTVLAMVGGVGTWPSAASESIDTFITRRGDKLFEGDTEYRFVSVNLPDILQIITNYPFDGEERCRLPNDFELRDGVRTVRQMGGRVLRTFVIPVRPEPAPAFMFAVGGEEVVPNEPALRVLDRLLQICHEEGVRLIVPFVAYQSATLRGDWTTYGRDFWTVGSAANRKFKRVLEIVLGRTNVFTGVRYRDDPAICAWQTGNELVIGADPDRRAWLHDIAVHVKRLAPRHLLLDGRNRPADVFGLYDEFFADPNLDGVSYHTYAHLPQANTAVGTLKLMRGLTRGKLPLLVTEIAMTTPPPTLRALLDEVIAGGTAGAAFWAVRGHNRDGGFYKHSDRGSQFEDLNWPGFPDPTGDLPEIGRERELLAILAEYAARIRGVPLAVADPPAPPTLLPVPDVGHISWQGSTGAQGYELQRAEAETGPWTVIEPRLLDHLVVCAPLFCDATAEQGRRYFYRLLARNAAGASAPSPVVGPVVVEQRWVVDELFDLTLAAATTNLQVARSYAHSPYREDVAVARRADPAQAAALVYRVRGRLSSFSAGIFDAAVEPRFFVRRGDGANTEVAPRITRHGGGRRARFSAGLSAEADTLEIVFGAHAPAAQAVGRVEISFTSKADGSQP